MKLKINELNPNPFKKEINKGKLDEDRVKLLQESIEHGTLPEHFFVRKIDDKYQLTYGHHRIEALKQKKGKEYEVDVTIVHYNDEQMLIDMVRENITQRNTDYRDTSESIILTRKWLQSKSNTVKQFNSLKKTGFHPKGIKGGSEPLEDSYRSVAKFLSKKGKAVSYGTVKNYLDITDKLDEDIKTKIKKFKSAEDTSNAVTFSQALALTKITDKKEQKELLDVMQKNKEELGGRPHRLLGKYKEAPEEIKKKVRKGEIDLRDIEYETKKLGYLKENNFRGLQKQSPNEWIIEISDSIKKTGELLDTVKLDWCKKTQLELLYRYIKVDFEKHYTPFLKKLLEKIQEVEVKRLK